MLDYAALAALSAVVREGSFDKAAAALGVTPSAISQRIRGLEERLGAVLVVRAAPCVPTPIGQRLCAHLDRVRLLESDVAAGFPGLARTPLAAPLRVAVNRDSLATWFPAAAAAFARGGDATLDLVLDAEEQTADRLRSGEVLAAVTADPVPVQGCRTVPLGALVYAAAASPDLVRRHFVGGIDRDRLARAPVIQFDRRDALQARWLREAHDQAIAAPTHWIPSTHGGIAMILGGLGWGMVPLDLAEPHLAAGRMIELDPGHRIAVGLFWQYSRIGASLLDRLTHAVRAVAAERLR